MSACGDQTATTPTTTIVQVIQAGRATRTPWPTLEVRDDQQQVVPGTSPGEPENGSSKNANKLIVVRGVKLIRTLAGGLEAVGEIWNNSPDTITRVQVNVSIRDEDATVISEKMVLVARDLIGPQETSPFRVHFPALNGTMGSIAIDALPGDIVDPSRLTRLNISERAISKENYQMIVRGRISNLTGINTELQPILYTVKQGDTLLDIAIKLGVNTDEIVTNNAAVSANSLQVGQVLTVRTAAKGVRLIATAYDNQKRVIGYRIVNFTDTTMNTPPSESGVPFEIVVVTLTREVADHNVIAEIVR